MEHNKNGYCLLWVLFSCGYIIPIYGVKNYLYRIELSITLHLSWRCSTSQLQLLNLWKAGKPRRSVRGRKTNVYSIVNFGIETLKTLRQFTRTPDSVNYTAVWKHKHLLNEPWHISFTGAWGTVVFICTRFKINISLVPNKRWTGAGRIYFKCKNATYLITEHSVQ